MEGLYRRSRDHLAVAGTHNTFREHYSNGEATTRRPRWHAAVLDLYVKAGREALRVPGKAGTAGASSSDTPWTLRCRPTGLAPLTCR